MLIKTKRQRNGTAIASEREKQLYVVICKFVGCLGKGNRVCFSFLTATAIETRRITVWLNRLMTVIDQDPGNPLLFIQVLIVVFVLGSSGSVG